MNRERKRKNLSDGDGKNTKIKICDEETDRMAVSTG